MEFFDVSKTSIKTSDSELFVEKSQRCQKCMKSFPTSQQLLQHSLVHSNLRKFSCAYCEKSFKQLSHLQQHQRIHTGERPYRCVIGGCTKAFRQLSSLQQHLKGHSLSCKNSSQKGEFDLRRSEAGFLPKPHDLTCQICEKQCANDQRFFKHMHKYHPEYWKVFSGGLPLSNFLAADTTSSTKDNPFLCSVCNKRYIHRTGYVKHMSSHADKQNNPMNGIECRVCKKVFSKEAYLIRHLEMKADSDHKLALEDLKTGSKCDSKVAKNIHPESYFWRETLLPSNASIGDTSKVTTTSSNDRISKKDGQYIKQTLDPNSHLPFTQYFSSLTSESSLETLSQGKYFSSSVLLGSPTFAKNQIREFQNCCQDPVLFANGFGGSSLSYTDVPSCFHYGTTSLEYYSYHPSLNSDTNLNATFCHGQFPTSDVIDPYLTRTPQNDVTSALQNFTRYTPFR